MRALKAENEEVRSSHKAQLENLRALEKNREESSQWYVNTHLKKNVAIESQKA